MKENPITFFRAEIKGVTFAELKLTPSTAAKGVLLALGITGAVLGSRYVVDLIDDTMRPQYIVNGSSAPSYTEEPPQWQRPTDWKKK